MCVGEEMRPEWGNLMNEPKVTHERRDFRQRSAAGPDTRHMDRMVIDNWLNVGDVGNRGWLSHVHPRQGVARHAPLKR